MPYRKSWYLSEEGYRGGFIAHQVSNYTPLSLRFLAFDNFFFNLFLNGEIVYSLMQTSLRVLNRRMLSGK